MKWHWDGNGNTWSKSNSDREYSLLRTLPYQRMLHGISDRNIKLGIVLQQTYFCSHWFDKKAGEHTGLVPEFKHLFFLLMESQPGTKDLLASLFSPFISIMHLYRLATLEYICKVSQGPVFGLQSLLALWPFLSSRQNNSTEPVSCTEPLTSDHTWFSQCPTSLSRSIARQQPGVLYSMSEEVCSILWWFCCDTLHSLCISSSKSMVTGTSDSPLTVCLLTSSFLLCCHASASCPSSLSSI